MSLISCKTIPFAQMLQDADLNGKEIKALYESLAIDNYVPGQPFVLMVDITPETQDDYESHWRKILNMLIEKHQCVCNEKVIVIE
mgnify:CR=1 FL=1